MKSQAHAQRDCLRNCAYQARNKREANKVGALQIHVGEGEQTQKSTGKQSKGIRKCHTHNTIHTGTYIGTPYSMQSKVFDFHRF